MKIQINSLEALERLIGDDKEMEISVKQSILNEFAKKHLKSIANSEAMETLKREVLKELKETGFYGLLKKTESKSIFYRESTLLSSETKELIKEQVKDELDSLISEEIAKIRGGIVQDINDRLNLMALSVSQCIREEIQKETLDKLVQKKLRDLIKE